MFTKTVIVLLGAIFVIHCNVEASTNKIVCYYGSWAVYRPGNGKFSVEDIDPTKCTHLIFSFLGMNSDGTVKILDEWNEIDNKALLRFNDLKRINPQLKTLIAIGGWNEGSLKYSQMAANPTYRRNLINSAMAFMQKYGFNGLDLDWEYPAQRGGSQADKANYATLIREFREAISNTNINYLLTAAVAATATAADISYDVPSLSRYLDWINLMAYDFHGSYDGVTGQNAPLYASHIDLTPQAKERNVAASVHAWLSRGAAPEKLVLGLGVYGRSFTLSTSNNGLGAPASNPGNAGPYTRESGMLGYNEICEMQKQGGWTTVWDNEQRVPYSYKGNQWVGYDNPESIKLKVQFAKSLGLGGAMIWSIETDDFKGICGEKYSILNAIRETLDDSGSEQPTTQSPTPPPSHTTHPSTQSPTQPPSHTTQPPESGNNECVIQGYFRDSTNCSKFYYCEKTDSGFIRFSFECPAGLVYDLTTKACNYSNLVQC